LLASDIHSNSHGVGERLAGVKNWLASWQPSCSSQRYGVTTKFPLITSDLPPKNDESLLFELIIAQLLNLATF
jgi:hypothetical protein